MTTDRRMALRGLRQGAATDGQGIVLDSGIWVPGDVVRSLVSTDGTIGIDLTDPLNPDLSVVGGGSGSGAGALLLNNTMSPVAAVPGGTAVGTLVFMKSGIPSPVTWDFRGLSALPSGWARRGVTSETFDAAGMQATYTPGQGHYYPLSTTAPGTLEAKMVSGPTSGIMLGPQIFGPAAIGAGTAWYSAPSGALILGVNSSHQYDGTFANAGGSPAYPIWFRVRYASSNVYGSFSTDGSSWSSEATIAKAMTGVNEISIGSLFGSSSAAKFEYVTWSQASTLVGGLLGWWDGSTIVAF